MRTTSNNYDTSPTPALSSQETEEPHSAEDSSHPVHFEVMLLLQIELQLLNALMRLRKTEKVMLNAQVCIIL